MQGWGRAAGLRIDAYFAPKQYTTPSSLAMTRRPSATAGEPVKPPPASYCQASLPVLMLMAYSRPSAEPTNARSPTMTGEESTRLRVGNDHSSSPFEGLRACTRLLRPPTITYP